MRQATEQELEGLENGWRELKIGELIPIGVPAMLKSRYRGAAWRRVKSFIPSENIPYNPGCHVIICIEAE